MADRLKVLIAGGGIGGLALAQGLLKAGVDVGVFERDEQSHSRLQGYRLSLTPDGLGALRRLLPEERWVEIVAACTAPLPGISFVSQRLEERFFRATPPLEGDVQRYSSISRISLRDILLRGIEDHVFFGRTCSGFEERDDGTVACRFDDGGEEVGDLLVGADGTRSAIRTHLLPASNRYETGVSAIAGKVPVRGDDAARMTAPPIGESAVVIGDAPLGLFIADHQLTGAQDGDSYIFWSLLARRERFPRDVEDAAPERLLDIADTMTEGWHPRLKDLIRSAAPDSAMLLDYASSHVPQPWRSDRVTLIGDAIHNMPPTGGEGGNMALKDAATLCTALAAASEPSVRDTLATYQSDMVGYAFEAVDRAMTNLQRMVARDDPRRS